VRDQFLVRIDVASSLHRRCLRPAQRLGIADQHYGERARRELLQYRKVEARRREMRQAGWQLSDHADPGGLAVEKGDEDRRQHRNDQGRRHSRR
jgi:hypothetical protein